MKTMYEMSAYKGKNKLKSVFIFSDNDVVHESFLEDVNNQLSSGSVPNLYAADELAKVREEARKFSREDTDLAKRIQYGIRRLSNSKFGLGIFERRIMLYP
jgi:hypothetical protein